MQGLKTYQARFDVAYTVRTSVLCAMRILFYPNNKVVCLRSVILIVRLNYLGLLPMLYCRVGTKTSAEHNLQWQQGKYLVENFTASSKSLFPRMVVVEASLSYYQYRKVRSDWSKTKQLTCHRLSLLKKRLTFSIQFVV